jgi:hypothetical protein
MTAAGASRNVSDMDKRDKRDGLRGTEVGEELAIGKQERHMADEERELARELRELENAEEHAEKEIGEELRREHWGHQPERPLRWPSQRGSSSPQPRLRGRAAGGPSARA